MILIFQLSGNIAVKRWLPPYCLVSKHSGGHIHSKAFFPRTLEILVGIVLIITSANTWFRFWPKKPLGRSWASAAGSVAGCLGGSIGASEPPVVIYTSLQPWTKSEIKATLVAFFMINGAEVFVFYFFHGFFYRQDHTAFQLVRNTDCAQVLAGILLYYWINNENYRTAVMWILCVLGILMLLKGTIRPSSSGHSHAGC